MLAMLLFSLLFFSYHTETLPISIAVNKSTFINKNKPRTPFETEITLVPTEEIITIESANSIEALNNISIEEPQQKNTSWKIFLKETGLAISLGCTVGALSGSLCQTLEAKNKIHWVGCWFLSSLMRSILLDSIMPSLKKNNIPHNSKMITTLAWATDWIVYIYKKNFLADLLN
jgi:hypothetical protein